jgi:hypothetical protein
MTDTTKTGATPAATKPDPIGPDGAGLHTLAASVTETAAARLSLTPDQVERAMLLSAWTTVAEMTLREFLGAYRQYYPKCGMALRNEAVIAEVFDAIAEVLDDPRRALRAGTYVPPAEAAASPTSSAATGGRNDG